MLERLSEKSLVDLLAMERDMEHGKSISPLNQVNLAKLLTEDKVLLQNLAKRPTFALLSRHKKRPESVPAHFILFFAFEFCLLTFTFSSHPPKTSPVRYPSAGA